MSSRKLKSPWGHRIGRNWVTELTEIKGLKTTRFAELLTGWPEQQKPASSQVWRLEVWDQGAGCVAFFLKLLSLAYGWLLLLLLSRFSRVQLCATPETAAHQAPPSLGFSRQEHWSGLPFPSPMHASEKWKWSRSVLSRVQLLATPWTAAHLAPPSMGFSRQEYWSGVPLPSPLWMAAFSFFLHIISLCTVCVISSSHKDNSHIGLGLTLKTLFYLDYLFINSVSKYSCSTKVQGIRTSTYGFEGYTISLMMPDIQIISFLSTILDQCFQLSYCLVPERLLCPWIRH